MEIDPLDAKLSYKLTATSLDMLGKLTMSGTTLSGMEHVANEGPQILAFSHHNSWDIPALGVSVYKHNKRPVHFMTKEELLGIPVAGAWLRINYAVPIDRDNPTREQLKNALDVLEGGGILGIAPEGGRIRTGEVPEKLRGGVGFFATRTSVEVVPVGIAGKNRNWAGGKFLPRPMHVHFGKPLLPGGKSRDDRRELDERLQSALVEVLDTAHELHPDNLR